MTAELLVSLLSAIASAFVDNLDVFFVNTSVFFFAFNLLQPKKDWEKELETTSTPLLKWETLVSFKENPQLQVTSQAMAEHPKWTIIYATHPTATEITIQEYQKFLDYDAYNEVYEIRHASERKNRWMAVYGAILLIIGTFATLSRNTESTIVATSVLCIYAVIALIVIKTFTWGIMPSVKVKPRPQRPSFLDL